MFNGTVIAIGTVVSWVCKTQFSQSMYSPDFDAPVLITWFSTIWMENRCFYYTVTNHLYVRTLGIIHAADVAALFSSSNAFVYFLSWSWLKEELSIFKV
ncbi:unnamed protein product [Pocillopora meandrina]|uniref:Uncharacterized protein n=1 Tax=Pocillopora meandrina TaxID=46732 RepID=A0AAU9XY55_9CNID|nr:unnamed protein product [Pocillopora meandrina]